MGLPKAVSGVAQLLEFEAIAGHGQVLLAHFLAFIRQTQPQVALGQKEIAREVVRVLGQEELGLDGGAAMVVASRQSLGILQVEADVLVAIVEFAAKNRLVLAGIQPEPAKRRSVSSPRNLFAGIGRTRHMGIATGANKKIAPIKMFAISAGVNPTES